MQTVGTRELKDQLTRYLRLVRRGVTLIVTDRGKPVAIVKPAEGQEEGSLDGILAGLAAEGNVSLPRGKGFLKKAPTVRGKGTSLSQMVLENRR